ncbi:MAG TPA: PilZ domain-containing protein [Candidatus Dormibacteraeota bacterium]|nr:PilZ domain-containing protein [Candidatus Dormibacteraeota bacterium]
MIEEKRRHRRVATPMGMWVKWEASGNKSVSRVCDLTICGLFISTPDPPAVGTIVKLLFVVPEGEIRTQSVVRNSIPNKGMGVEITAMRAEDRARLGKLVKRLSRVQDSDKPSYREIIPAGGR